jgi:hypothetical protein
LVRAYGAALEVVEEELPEGLAAEVEAQRQVNASEQHAVQALREAIADQVAVLLPFEEPRTEFGQEDGALRRAWTWAYRSGHREYEYNLDLYPVFTSTGRPRVPQVCIDFIVDSLERASGTWWADRGQTRTRRVGGLDLRSSLGSGLRQTESFITFAREHNDWFDVLEVDASERVPMGQRSRFFADLHSKVEDFRVGDIVFVRGFTPWDKEKPHTHSFFIYETDPITGIPILVAGNAGPANLWSWEKEAQRTPQRTVRYRVRPKSTWLQEFALPAAAPDSPPELLPSPPRKPARVDGPRLAQG